MTIQEAYSEGFCKTAAANGVDPEQLMKFAVELRPIWNGLRSLYNMRAGNALMLGGGLLGAKTLLKDLYNKKMGKNVNINQHSVG